MTTYTAIVKWMEHGKRDYKFKSKIVRGIKAPDIVTASQIALQPFKDRIMASISCIWHDWPQPKETS